MRFDAYSLIIEYFNTSKEKIGNRSNIYLIFILIVLACVAIMRSVAGDSETYSIGENGSVSNINIADGEIVHSFDISLTQGDSTFNTEVELKFSIPANDVVQEHSGEVNNSDLLVEKIDEMIFEIENSIGEEVFLPQKLGDDIDVFWSVKKDYSYIWVIIFLFIMVILHNIDKKNKVKKIEIKKRESLLYALPDFVNKIVLLSNAGMTLQDTINSVISGYSMQKDSQKNMLLDEIVMIAGESKDKNTNMFVLFNEYARKSGVRELSRIANMLLESFYLGTDLISKIEREREMLWSVRMKAVKSKGKLAESKLLIPLSMLLVTLIVVTMAPAMLQL